MQKDVKIAIIGAGVSGLIAAQVLESQGYTPTIYEASDRAGGRVKTDIVQGYQLDHGFQVLLDAYPMAKKYLDYTKLDLGLFKPGAMVFKNGTSAVIGDPLRDLSLAIPTLRSGIGSLKDKWAILKLNSELKTKTIAAIFSEKETSTLAYLQHKGFSKGIINDFFKPFFTGIFLETELSTSSSMFQFVYKMFGSGNATLPKAGIEAIPKQLVAQLKTTTINYNTSISACEDHKLTFANGSTQETDFTIIATEASHLVANLRNQETAWKTCDTLYFKTKELKSDKPLIGLVAQEDTLINNIFFHSTLPMQHRGEDHLLSVTVVKNHQLAEQELITRVVQELKQCCNISDAQFLKRYEIKKALPLLHQLQGSITPSETRLTASIFLAGDQLLNGSLNAAMTSGEAAAQAVVDAITETIVG